MSKYTQSQQEKLVHIFNDMIRQNWMRRFMMRIVIFLLMAEELVYYGKVSKDTLKLKGLFWVL